MNRNIKKSELTIAPITRKASGPRTHAGKERSKQNARKHGIFSKVVLLPNESRSEFDSLLSGLRENHQPKTMDENLLVDKLATLWWRYRRLIIAETAEIERGAKFLEWDEKEQQEQDAQESPHNNSLDVFADDIGLTRKMANPRILERCLDLLDTLRVQFERYGFDSESPDRILTELYGSSDHCVATLLESYRTWKNASKVSEDMSEHSKSFFLSDLRKESQRINQYKKVRASIDAERMKLESLRRSVPNGPQLDRLLKYEASINREIDRTLTQLERLQRMRLGQPVSSPIKFDISSS